MSRLDARIRRVEEAFASNPEYVARVAVSYRRYEFEKLSRAVADTWGAGAEWVAAELLAAGDTAEVTDVDRIIAARLMEIRVARLIENRRRRAPR